MLSKVDHHPLNIKKPKNKFYHREKKFKNHSNPRLSKQKQLTNVPATLSTADLAFSGWPYQLKILLESNEQEERHWSSDCSSLELLTYLEGKQGLG